MTRRSTDQLVIIYDGVCRLCNGLVSTLIALDPDGSRFKYCAVQSEAGLRLLRERGIRDEDAMKSFVVIDRSSGRHYQKSDAALLLATRLGPGSRALGVVGGAVPQPLRDFIYDTVAANRYAWFGKLDACLPRSPAIFSRFLDADEIGASGEGVNINYGNEAASVSGNSSSREGGAAPNHKDALR